MKYIKLHVTPTSKYDKTLVDPVAIVDDADYDMVKDFKWYIGPHGDVLTWYYKNIEYKTTGTLMMHRLIIDAVPGKKVIHINRNKLDNQRSNICYSSDKPYVLKAKVGRKHGYRGVSKYDNRAGTTVWLMKFQMLEDNIYINERYTCMHAAAYAYNKHASRLYKTPDTVNDLSNSGFTIEELEQKLITDRLTKQNRLFNYNHSNLGIDGYPDIIRRIDGSLYKYRPMIRTIGKNYRLGAFEVEEHAIAAYKAVKELIESQGIKVL
jgi:transcriptional regulator CtsR